MMRSGDYGDLARAFDAVAPDYDRLYGPEGNAVMAWVRVESLKVLLDTFPVGSHLLELGCGTGAEAIELARAGRSVVATDISPGMVAQARQKAARAKVEHAITTVVKPAAQVADLAEHGPFDGAYASFGVLNAEPDLMGVVDALAELLPPGAAFVTSVMSHVCLWEMFWYGLHLQPRQALRRWRRWGRAPVGEGQSVPTQFYRPMTLPARFRPAFRVERKVALPLLLPPPYLEALFRRRRSLFGKLENLERRVRGWFPLYALGDHFLMVLRRV
jgi:SAM-dependent methyltransferase